MAETDGVGLGALLTDGVWVGEGLLFGSEALALQSGVDDGLQVQAGHVVAKVGDAFPTNGASGEDGVAVGLVRLSKAVGGHEDRAGEVRELNGLTHPGTTKVTG